MKNKLGFKGQTKPKDYTKEKYIVLPEVVRFSKYFEEVGSISPIILESEISLSVHDIKFLPFKVNVFDRAKFESKVKYANEEVKEFYKKLAIMRGKK